MAEHAALRPRNSLRGLFLCSLAVPGLLGGTAHGQNAEGTALQRIRLKGYGMYSEVHPDFLGSPRNKGFTAGGDIDGFRLLPHTEIGMDVRYSYSQGPITNQSYYGGGPRLTLYVGRFKPYVDFLFGQGHGTFNTSTDPTYVRDKSGALAYGGGLEYQVTRSWGVRADLQRQRWRYSIHQPIFYPEAASVGLTYQFRFHSRTGPNL